MIYGENPFRHWIIDGAVPAVPSSALPSCEWPGWEARYDNDCESGKRTARAKLPGEIAGALKSLRSAACVASWSGILGYPVEDDPTLHGGGLHLMEPGGWLNVHLDYDRHPLIPGRRRALNLIAFVHPEWRLEWGGRLLLCDPTGKPVVRIDPTPGRLVAFEVGDQSYHGVEPVVGPANRVSIAAYMLSPAGSANTRRRALFIPNRTTRG